jgi:predicted ATPase/DNA-binding winged helix-turn-helix (wHTH) protein
MAPVVFEFGGYRLDDERLTLTGPDGPIHCEPQVFRVLHHLVRNRHRVVPKGELLDTVWGDRFVSESALTSRLKAARRAVGDDGQAQRTIETVHGVGYAFVAAVETIDGAEGPVDVSHRRLPTLRSELIGRETDLAGVLATVRSARATTIVGPGGVGKTSLSLAAGHALQTEYADGAVFVDLTATRSAEDVTRTMADSAGVEGEASRSLERLGEHLATRRVLVVLDNCEHVLTLAAELVDLLLARGPDARILATSREPLSVPGEHVWPLAPLTADAPALFVERARAADPRVRWTPADPAIVELCDRLDGLPLALELAAGQLRRWGFAELSRRLQGELSLLARSAHRSESRHGTMAAAIDWSYQLLDERERTLLRHLSVFPSSFTVGAAEAVVPPAVSTGVPTTLGDLVDKSLVVRDLTTDRYRMLETIRVFAGEHLEAAGEAEAALERNRQHVVDEARSSTRLDRWCSARLGAERRDAGDQARQAFRASLDTGQVADAVEISVGASFLWRQAIGCTEGQRWMGELLDRELAPADRIWALILQADIGQGIGDFGQVLTAAEEAWDVDDRSDAAATCIVAHYRALAHLTDPARCRDALTPVLAMAADTRLLSLVQAFLAVPEIAGGAGDDLLDHLERLHDETSEDGYDRYILNWVGWLFGLARRQADVARLWMGRQHAFLARTGFGQTWLTSLSNALTESVEGSDVRELMAGALALADREGYRAEGDGALALAYSEACRGEAMAAAELLGTATRSRFNSTAHYVLYRVVVEPVVRRQLEPAEFEAALERGGRRTAEEALAASGIG